MSTVEMGEEVFRESALETRLSVCHSEEERKAILQALKEPTRPKFRKTIEPFSCERKY